MIFGNLHSVSSCDIPRFLPYIELLKTLSKDTPDGKVPLENGAYYNVFGLTLSEAPDGKFEAHREYLDLQYILEGDEQMEYADLKYVTEVSPYVAENDAAFYQGEGSRLKLHAGDFVIFYPTDAHKPGLGNGTVRKVVVKIPV